jgi:Ser/Thr protein kinase RdoA (MazF antagonist)
MSTAPAVDDDDERSSFDTSPVEQPPGGSTDKERLLYEALGKFVSGEDLDDYTFEPTSGGVNNVVYYVKKKEKKKGDGSSSSSSSSLLGVIRVYNNSNDDPKVAFEHGILERLAALPRELSFGIPETMPSIHGNRFERLSGGASACLFRSIPGGLPKLSKVREIGSCAGELSSAMAEIDRSELPDICPNFPYWDIYEVHKAVTRETFYEQLRSGQFDPWRESANFVEDDLTEVMERVSSYQGSLPWSFIHGDLHYDNILVDDDGVTGLLDFEFSSYDWRAMELAICLSKYCSEDDPYPYFERFVDGFAVLGDLNDKEIEAMSTLIRLRILSNVVYFVGRAMSGEDQMSTLTCRIDNYCQRLRWVKNNEDAIASLIRKKFAANNKL